MGFMRQHREFVRIVPEVFRDFSINFPDFEGFKGKKRAHYCLNNYPEGHASVIGGWGGGGRGK